MLATRKVVEVVLVVLQSNTKLNIKMAKLQMFNRKTGKVSDFLTVCRLYIKMRMRDVAVEE